MRVPRWNTAEHSRPEDVQLGCPVTMIRRVAPSPVKLRLTTDAPLVFKLIFAACLSTVSSATIAGEAATSIDRAAPAYSERSPARIIVAPVAAGGGAGPPAGTRVAASGIRDRKRRADDTSRGGRSSRQDTSSQASNPMMRDPGPETDNMPIKRPPKSATHDRIVHDRIGRDTLAR